MPLYKVVIKCAPLIGCFIQSDILRHKFSFKINISNKQTTSTSYHFCIYTSNLKKVYSELRKSNFYIFAKMNGYPVKITIVRFSGG